MNIEIANRLQQLRKKHCLSQEELAEKIGVSRQAVSKWERAEASPDTDNLILLSQLYGISLDELLRAESVHLPDKGVSLKKGSYADTGNAVPEMFPENYTDEEIFPRYSAAQKISVPQGPPFGADIAPRRTNAAAGSSGKRRKISAGNRSFAEQYETAMGKLENGLENSLETLGNKIENNIDRLSVKMESQQSGSKNTKTGLSLFDKTFPLMVTVLFAFMAAIGFAHPGWTLFMLIPMYYTFMAAVKKRNPMIFCYPVLCAFIYFTIGGMFDHFFRHFSDEWYSLMWLIFLTIPLYYTGYIAIKKHNPMIFCYPVLALILYLGIGMFVMELSPRFGELWFFVAWIPFLASIPFYYIVISHFRNKRRQADPANVS